LRQRILLQYKQHNEDIVIIAVDDPSYEYITEKFGAWPTPRSFWADMINETRKSNIRIIAFDLLFLKRFSNEVESDNRLINAVISNDNVLVAMDFDDFEPSVRRPPELPQTLKNTVINDNIIKNNPHLTFTNCRRIMDDLVNGASNIGIINVVRDDDGVIRTFPPMLMYRDDYYKNLSLLAGLRYLDVEKREFEVRNGDLILNRTHSIPLGRDGRAVLNWYGPENTFKYISAYKVYEAIVHNDRAFLDENFKGKVAYVGTTVRSLMDVKTTPTTRLMPGVEIHATFLNNLIDNDFIRQVSVKTDILIALLLCAIVGVGVFKFKSIWPSVILALIVFVGYFGIATLLMHFFNIWVGIVLPVGFALIIFLSCYIAKYFIVFRDYEHTYKLATTDALTEMYNHRYFQEQMLANTNSAKRYETPYSLILTDIDFFKKFNDTHGHQSGDAVLRQVGLAIKKSVRSTDFACRYGGEEMAVILPNTKKEEAIIVAKKIHATIESGKFELATGAKTNVTVSVGVASMPQDGDSPASLIEYADKCLYKAKQEGRNRVISEVDTKKDIGNL
jgi:diguanylate cyclase (GGDEF)-like protein